MTNLNIHYKVTINSVNPMNISLEFRPLHSLYFDLYDKGYGGVGIDPINPEPVNEIFASLEDALHYYTTDENRVPYMISQINSDNSTDFVFGELTQLTPEIFNALSGKTNVFVPGEHIEDALNDATENLSELTIKYNDLATKFNTLLDRVETAGIVETN